MKNDIKISIIIPSYNVEKYINECLDSLINQTFKEFEIIVVDDGSSDNTINILNEYQANYNNIKIIQQENQYAGVARNNGMKYAQGEYLLFLDSDDFFELDMLEKIYNKAKESDADVVLFDADVYDDRNNTLNKEITRTNKSLLPSKTVFSQKDTSFLYQIFQPNTWTKLFKKDFILENQIYFSNTKNANDLKFVFIATACAKKIVYLDRKLVHYRKHTGISIGDTTKINETSILNVFLDTYLQLKDKNKYTKNIEHSFLNAFIHHIYYPLKSKNYAARLDFISSFLNHRIYKENLSENELESYFSEDSIKEKAIYINQIITIYNWKEKYLNKDYNTSYDILKSKHQTQNPAISIVIPVYNTSQFVKECIDSIINQTFKDIEIICVNDGSSDKSLDILKDYLDKDISFKIVTYQDNKGLSYARNVGIKQANGEYIYTIDSDDFLELNGLKLLYNKAKEYDLDTLFFDAKNTYENQEVYDKYAHTYEGLYIRKHNYEDVYRGVDILERFIKNGKYLVNVPFQFIKRSFFIENELWFINGIVHEDNIYTFKSMLKAKRVSHISEVIYNRRFRDDSIMTSKLSFYNLYSYFINYQLMIETLIDLNNQEYKYNTIKKITNSIINNIRNNYSKLEESEKETYKYLDVAFRIRFENIIIDFVKKNKELEKAKKKIYRIKSSKSYKLSNKISKIGKIFK